MLRAEPLEPDTRLRNVLTVYLDDETHYSLLKARQVYGVPLATMARQIMRLWLLQQCFMPYPQMPAGIPPCLASPLPQGPTQPEAPPIPQTPSQAAPVKVNGGRSRHG
jgi:hypothetical protein